MSTEIDTWLAQMPAADREVEELRQRVGRISRLFERLLDEVARDHGISRADWAALAVIIRSQGVCTPSELARTLVLTSGTVSTRIKRLAQAGFIERGSGDDARSRPVTVTQAGRRVWAAATEDRTSREAHLLRAALDGHDLTAINRGLADLLAALETELGPSLRHDIPPPGHA